MGDWFSAVNLLTNARAPLSIQKSVMFHLHWNITLQLPIVPNFNMQTIKTNSFWLQRSETVGRFSSVSTCTKKLAGLEPIDLISHCCNRNCFKKFDNVDNLRQLRETFLQFTNATLKKQFLKDLLLCRVPDSIDYMDKQFRIDEFPVCYVCVHKLFGVYNNLLTGMKGTPHARSSMDASRPSCAGLTFHGCDFTKRARSDVVESSEIFL